MTTLTLKDKKAMNWIQAHKGSITYHTGYIHFNSDGSIDWKVHNPEMIDYVEVRVGFDSEFGRSLIEATERRMSLYYRRPVNLELFEEETLTLPHNEVLSFGETPWDHSTREELLIEVKRMYSALNSARGVLRAKKKENHPFWGKDGYGGTTLEKIDQIINPIHSEYDSDNISLAFFRYADDLLFKSNEFSISDGWHICPACGQLVAVGSSLEGEKCSEHSFKENCTGILKKLEWADMKSRKNV